MKLSHPLGKRWTALAIAGALAASLGVSTISQAAPSVAASVTDPTQVHASGYLDLTMGGRAAVTKQLETQVAPGIRLTEFERLEPRGWQQGAVLDIDLTNPKVSLDYLDNGVVASTNTLSNLAARAENIKAAVNGDFFDINNSGAPLGVGVDPDEGLIKSPTSPRNALVLDSQGLAQITNVSLAGNLYGSDWQIPVTGVNTHAFDAKGVGIYTSRWGTYQRVNGNGDRAQGVEVWIDRKSKVIRGPQPIGAGEIPADVRVVAARPGEVADKLRTVQEGDTLRVAYAVLSDADKPVLAIGGDQILVRDGQPVPHGDQTVHPRTAAGIANDGARLLLAVVDGRTSISRGMSLTELGEFMRDLGSDEAFNLDGGGSTTAIAQKPGDDKTSVINNPSDGGERHDPNGLGVKVAPGSGELDGYTVEPMSQRSGLDRVFPGLHRPLIAKGFDENRWPTNVAAESWTSSTDAASVTDGVVTGVKPGKTVITAATGDKSGELPMQVLGELDRIVVRPNTLAIPDPSRPLRVEVIGYDKQGFGAPIDPSDVTVTGNDEGLVEFRPGTTATFTARALQETGSATMTFTVGKLSAQIAVTIGTEEILVTSIADPSEWYSSPNARSTNSVAPAPEGRTDDKAVAVTLGFNEQTGTRTANVRPKEDRFATWPQLDGTTQTVGAWFKGDGKGEPSFYITIEDAKGKWHYLYGPRITGTEWKKLSVTVPATAAQPIKVRRVAFLESTAARQYKTTVLFDDIFAVVAPRVEAPKVEQYVVDAISPDGAADAKPLRIAVMSDSQFVGRNPNSIYVEGARRVIRQIVAEKPDRVLIVGDFTDEGAQIDMDLAKQILDEELVPSGIPFTYVPGNHEAMGAADLAPFKNTFGDTYTVTDVQNTRIITLNSAPYALRHDAQQIKFFQEQLNGAISDDSITGVVLALHHPTRDNLLGLSALNNKQDADLIEQWTAKVRAAGKSVVVLNAGVGAFDVYRVDGVTHATNGNSGKGPNSTPDRGGFTGWTMVGIDPAQGRWQSATSDWLTLEFKPFVDQISISGPNAAKPGDHVQLTGTIEQDGRQVPAKWPVSYTWAGADDTVYVGDPTSAPETAVVALDPVTGEVTALDRVVVDGQVTKASDETRLVSETSTNAVEISLTSNRQTATHAITVVLPVGTNEPEPSPIPTPTPTPQYATPRASGRADVYLLTDKGMYVHDGTNPTERDMVFSEGGKANVTMLKQHNWVGSGKADVFERTASGQLTLQIDGKGESHVIGRNWNGINEIVPMGGGMEPAYLMARHVNGNLYGYRWDGRVLRDLGQIGKGWGGMMSIMSVGDLGTNGNSDIVAINRDGSLWMYQGTGNGRVTEGKRLGGGWGAFTAFSPGDVDGDGRKDLMGVRRADGALFLYRNNGRGFAAATAAGRNFDLPFRVIG